MNEENSTNKKKVIKIKIKPKSSMTTQTVEKEKEKEEEEPPTTDAAAAAIAETSTSTYKIETCDYTIINCCCIKGLTTMKNENKKIHLTVTSPPYYNVKDYVNYADYKDYLSTLRTVFTLIYEITEDGRMCCVNLSNILIQRESRNCESSRIPLAFHFVPLMEDIGWKFIKTRRGCKK